MYNMTVLTNADNVQQLWVFANDSSGGILIGLGMISIFFIMMFVLKKYDFDEALLASSFSCFVLSTILTYAKMLNFMFPLLFLVFMAFTALYVFMVKRN